MPAQAGIHRAAIIMFGVIVAPWMPACAGITEMAKLYLMNAPAP
jgi:hypothetical protein